MKIAVAGTGYVGLSIATLLAQHNDVVAVDVVADKVDIRAVVWCGWEVMILSPWMSDWFVRPMPT